MPLYLCEADVEALLSPADAIEAIESYFARATPRTVSGPPRARLHLEGGRLETMAAVDLELGVAGLTTVAAFAGAGARELVVLLHSERPETLAFIEASRLGQLQAGAVSAVAARRLARAGARTLGVIGCGRQAAGHVECVREALPALDEVVVYCRNQERLAEFCRRLGTEPAEYGRDAAERDIIVTATSSRDPVLRGEWLRPGALVCATGATRPEARELDNRVLERAAFVCCDSVEHARLDAGDLIEPVERGVLDWLEVHELAEVVGGEVEGRQRDEDVVLFKSLGLAAEYIALGKLVYDRARERSVGVELHEGG